MSVAPIEKAIGVLEAGLSSLVVRIGKPVWIPEKNRQRFEYASRDPRILQVLKGVRIVSGLKAAVVLYRNGYVAEMGVLFRTINDYTDEIVFVEEGLQNGETADHKRFIENFFKFETRTSEELIADARQSEQVSRKKIQASIGRLMNPKNPSRMRQLARVIHNMNSTVVHGSYQSAMELYEGGTDVFRVGGMLDTSRMSVYRWQLAHHTHAALNTLGEVAFHLGLPDVFREMRDTRRELEQSAAYKA